VSDIKGFVVYAFGEDASGKVIAVGSRQGIWEESDGRFIEVHARPGPPLAGRPGHGDILHGIGYLDPVHPGQLVAYGSLHLAFWRDANRRWQVADNDQLAQRGTLGPQLVPPGGCHPSGWHWLSSQEGFLDCHEGQGYLYVGTTSTPLGPLPAACRKLLGAVDRNGADLFLVCGAGDKIWRRTEGESSWSRLPGVSGVRALSARGSCLVVATERAVLRRCPAVSK
jgi:hypothetical protein